MILKIIKYIFFLVIILIVGCWVWFTYQINLRLSQDKTNVIFVIEEGWGVNEISQGLFESGLIKNKLAFETYAWLWGKEDKFIAGRHNLNKTLTIRQLTKYLTTEASPRERDITIIEGWNLKQIGQYFENEGIVSNADFLNYVSNVTPELKSDYQFLEDLNDDESLEGYLFPDTYRIFNKTTIEEIVGKMLNNFDKKLTADLRDEITRQGKTIEEVVILASIVEKEVATDEDRKIVAGIFQKRLRDYYPLQSDATVNYVTGKNLLQPTREDTQIDNRYNTYKYLGLPPGPICNPGISSLLAVIYPNYTPDYYFLTTPDGQVIYSKTYAEHLRNKQKYLNN